MVLILRVLSCISGVGYDVLVNMLKYICPTHVVKIGISTENMNLPAGKFWLDGKNDGTIKLIEIRSACRDSLNGT
jgi:polynucleotide 5'-hydroxyl-kinase GRC3/NOL9